MFLLRLPCLLLLLSGAVNSAWNSLDFIPEDSLLDYLGSSSSFSSWVCLVWKPLLPSATLRSQHIKLLKLVAVSCLVLGSCWEWGVQITSPQQGYVTMVVPTLTASLAVINRKITQVEWFEELKMAQKLLKASPYLHSCETERSWSENEFGPRAHSFLSLRLQPTHDAASLEQQSKSHFQVRWGQRALRFLWNRSFVVIYCVCKRAFVRLEELLQSLSDNYVQNVK